MKRLCKSFPLLVVGLFCVACVSPPLTMDRLQTLSRGMDHKSVQSSIGRLPAKAFQVQENGSAYAVEVYPMQTGTTTHTTYHYMPGGGGYPVTTTVPVTEPYVFIYDAGNLLFWGFLADCQKADDTRVQQLAPLISEQL